MRKEEFERRSAEMKARMLAQKAAGREPMGRGGLHIQAPQAPKAEPQASPDVAPECFRIDRPHPLISSTRRRLKEERAYGPLLHLIGTESLDISVGKNSVARALWFMQSLITKCESAGIRFTVAPKYPLATTAVVEDTPVQVRIKEKTKRTEKLPSTQEAARRQIHESQYWSREYEYSPSGLVYFEIREWRAPRKNWLIPTAPPMDDCFESILANLRKTAQALKKAEQDRREEEAKRREEERRRFEEQQKRAEEAKRIEELRQIAAEWDESVRLAAYLDAFEKHVSTLGCDLSSNTGTGRWLAWARDYSRRLNPISRTTMDEAGTGNAVISRI
jgi:hypothetical protein